MCHKLDHRFFEDLNRMGPSDVCRRSLAEYDDDNKLYRLQALGQLYEVDALKREICLYPGTSGSITAPPVSVELGLAILFYLMKSRDIPISGKWISEKELRGGVTFFRGPHAFPTPEIARECGKDLETLHQAAKRMGGGAC